MAVSAKRPLALGIGNFPDPFIMRQGSPYYAFATTFAGRNVRVASLPDLMTRSSLPDALPTLPTLPAWATPGHTWAPEILTLGSNQYVMYYTARDAASGFQCVSRAFATNPEGPYHDDSMSAFACQVSGGENFCGSIDPSPFVDTDGKAYLIWKSDENARLRAAATTLECTAERRRPAAPGSGDGIAGHGSSVTAADYRGPRSHALERCLLLALLGK